MEVPTQKKARVANLQPWVPDSLADILQDKNGIPNIERFLFSAEKIASDPGVAKEAAAVLEKEGIVCIPGALSSSAIAGFKSIFPELITKIRKFDPEDKGSRGEKRHSFGGMSSTNSQLHLQEWHCLVDIPAVVQVLTSYWESADFAVAAAGGDLNMAGSRQHQILHSDLSRNQFMGPKSKAGSGAKAPMIAVNFLIEEQTQFNGPLQHLPGTQLLDLHYIPKVNQEPEHWLFSTMCPAPAGTAVIRDIRAWHAGSPNITTADRPLPNCEYIAPFVVADKELMKQHRISTFPGNSQIAYEDWEKLPEVARHLTRLVRAEKGVEVKPDVIYKMLSFAEECQIAPLFKGCVQRP